MTFLASEPPASSDEYIHVSLPFVPICSLTGLSAGVSLLVDARNTKTHGPVKQLLEKLVVSTQVIIYHSAHRIVKNDEYYASLS